MGIDVISVRIKRALSLFVCFFAVLPLLAEGVSVRVAVPNTVAVGERFQLSYSINDRASDIALPEMEDFSVLMGPSTSSSSSHSIVNGKVESSRETVFTYILRANKVGTLTIPPVSITSGKETYQSNAVTIQVVNSGTKSNEGQHDGTAVGERPQGGGDLILQQTLTKSSVYEGEGTQLVTKVYTRVNLNSLSDRKDPKLSEFVVVDLGQQNVIFHDEMLNGVLYQSAELDRKVIIPQKSGKLTIEPVEMEFIVKKRVRRGGGGFFDGFFDDVQMARQRVRSKSVTVNVKPLPAGKPASFSGGVGSFKFDVSVSPKETEIDNSVQVKVSVEGQGNLKLLSIPKPIFHQDFDTFDPNKKSDINPTAAGYKGKRTDEYLIIPRRDGVFEIPRIQFSFFDPAKGQYQTISKGPFSINVKKGEGKGNVGQGNGVVFSGAGPEQVTYTNSDLRYLHRSKGLEERGYFFVLSPLFWFLFFVPIAALGVLFVIYRKNVYENANVGLVRSRKANKVAKRRLKQAAKFIVEDKREAFFDEVMRALWGYLSDKLTLPLSVLTKDNAKEKMDESGVKQELADEFMNLLDECEFARYAPASVTATLDEVYQKAADIIGKIEGNDKK